MSVVVCTFESKIKAMREIKFRVWDTEENKYFEPVYEAYKGMLLDLSIGLGGRLMRRTLQMPAEDESNFKGRYLLEQFTGLTDKNGEEIYSGDILDTNHRPLYYVVDWINYMAAWFPFCKEEINKKGFEFEVIGNIHTDKHLLK